MKKDIFIQLYQEHAAWSRHQESQRSTTSNLIITIAALLISFIVFDKEINHADIPVSIFLMLIGLFGVIFSYKYYERFCFHDGRVESYKSILNGLIDGVDILSIESKADDAHRKVFLAIGKYGVYSFWMLLHFSIFVLGLILTLMASF